MNLNQFNDKIPKIPANFSVSSGKYELVPDLPIEIPVSILSGLGERQGHFREKAPSLDQSPCVTMPLLQAHRTCNTGALIPKTTKTDRNSFKVDWLEMTLVGVSWETFVVDYLGLPFDVFVLQDFGRHGYADLRTYGGVQVCCTDANPERGTKCILSATALDEVGFDACEIISRGIQDGASFARIDVAYDDFSGSFDYESLYDSILSSGELVTHFRTANPQSPYYLSGERKGQRSGEGFVLGSGSSSRQVVIYNKLLERIHAAIKAGEPLPDFPEGATWWRVEVRFKKDSALYLAMQISKHRLDNAGQIFRGVIDFREPSDKKNNHTADRDVCEWWGKLMSVGEIIRTGILKPVVCIERKVKWLAKSCGKAMGQVATIVGFDVLNQIMRQGAIDTTEKEWRDLRSSGLGSHLAFCKFDLVDGIPF